MHSITTTPLRQHDRLPLSTEDLQIMTLIADGHPMSTVALRLNLSDRTVRRRTRAICDQFGARAPIQVVVWATRHGLI